MSLIKTGWWWAQIPDDHIRISISRGSPRGVDGGWRAYRALAPGPWFRTASPSQYLTLYAEILADLDPAPSGVGCAIAENMSGGAEIDMAFILATQTWSAPGLRFMKGIIRLTPTSNRRY